MKSKSHSFFLARVILSSLHIVICAAGPTLGTSLIQVNRDSVAFDTNFNQIPANQGRYKQICVASRPLVTICHREGDFSAWDVDGDVVLCSDALYAYATTDGNNFTLIADTGNKSVPFKYHRSPNDTIKSIKVMDDGSWILCLGDKSIGAKGNLFRSTDKGSTWMWVLQFESGCVGDFGWYAVAGNEVAIGEYGYRPQYNSPRRIYYSDDYGANWYKIYEPYPIGQHLHLVAFSPGNTDVLYASYGEMANQSPK